VVRLVGTGKRVLELGCSTGYMSRILRDRGCRVIAVEQDAAAATRARQFCERVIVGDVEQLDLRRTLAKDRFDVVVAADVLEHLKDPLALLRALRSFIRADGYLVVSLPNVAHGSVRLALLGGVFKYTEIGLLDRTHLRFYTRQSMEELFDQAEYAIGPIERQILPLGATEVAHDPTAVSAKLLERLARDPEALTYQFIVVAFPVPKTQLQFIQRRLIGLAAERDDALQKSHDAVESKDETERRIQEMAANLEAVGHEIQSIREARDGIAQQLVGATRESRAIRERVGELTEENEALRIANANLIAAEEARLAEATAARRAREAETARGQTTVADRDRALDAIGAELALTKARMAGMRATKVWRIGKCYWWIEARVKSLFRL
jgi:SAM-dependent methyltransferase/regulator of replication initiation timing